MIRAGRGKTGLVLACAWWVALAGMPQVATAQDDARWNALYDRIIRLEAEIRRLKRDYDARLRDLEAALRKVRRQGAASAPAPSSATGKKGRRADAGVLFEPLPPLREPTATLDLSPDDEETRPRQDVLLGRIGESGAPPATTSPATPSSPAVSRPGSGPIPLPGAVTDAVGAGSSGPASAAGSLAPGRVTVAPLPPPSGAHAGGAVQGAPAPQAVAIPPALAGLSSGKLLEKARQNFLARRYDKAEQAYRAWLARFGHASQAPEVLYELGETLYIRGRFREAGKMFVEAYRAAGNNAQLASRALLRLGQSLKRMGKKKEACKAWNALRQRYPDTRAARLQAPREMKRAKCGK